jgi:hypothetical protein
MVANARAVVLHAAIAANIPQSQRSSPQSRRYRRIGGCGFRFSGILCRVRDDFAAFAAIVSAFAANSPSLRRFTPRLRRWCLPVR